MTSPRRRRQAAALIIAALVATGWAGCLGQAPFHPVPLFPLKAFTVQVDWARNETRSGPWTWSLQEPHRIVDRDGERRLAYPLVVTNPADDPSRPPFRHTYWLDEELRFVREDIVCQNPSQIVDGDCKYAEVLYGRQGALSPLGIGWPGLLKPSAAGSWVLPYSRWSQPVVDVPVSVHRTAAGGLVLEVAADPYVPAGSQLAIADSFFYLKGRYEYPPDSILPSRVTRVGQDGSRFAAALSKVEWGNALPSAERWPRETPTATKMDRSWKMFPGEDRDDFGRGFTHQQARDWLVENSPEARADADQDCLTFYRVHLLRPRELPVIGSDSWEEFQFQFTIGEENRVHHWQFDRHQHSDLFGTQTTYGNLQGHQGSGDGLLPCSKVRSALWPTVSSGDFFRLASQVPVRAFENRMSTFLYGREPSLWEGRAYGPETGWWTYYTVTFRPSYKDDPFFASYKLYRISMEAAHGWWVHLVFHPQDLAQWEAGVACEPAAPGREWACWHP
jgi:hypothetical protein